GAASIFGDKALEVAIVLKLGRTLWIIPLVLFSAWYFRETRSGTGLPIFVVFFIFAVILNSLLSPSEQINIYLKQVNKVFLLSGLFCIGTQINQSALQRISIKPLILAILVWSMVIIASLWII
ncbi:MAG: putative sulfate exporter family transporter, partial [Pseudomonadota bacterium]|nr:putative sulfate exporter family transporter [Pseudomonadota bacterium]